MCRIQDLIGPEAAWIKPPLGVNMSYLSLSGAQVSYILFFTRPRDNGPSLCKSGTDIYNTKWQMRCTISSSMLFQQISLMIIVITTVISYNVININIVVYI